MANLPRPYDINDPHEMFRLYRELYGYMKVSLHDGTDLTGRRHALDALRDLRRKAENNAAKQAKDAIESVKLSSLVDFEFEVVNEIERVLREDGFDVIREKKIGPRSRIDLYLPQYRIGIEVKKGKPNTKIVAAQLERYAFSSDINALILVSERGLHRHLSDAHGKQIHYVSLAGNWGLTV